jgi:hypothetical protein
MKVIVFKGNDQEVKFHEIKIQLFQEFELFLIRMRESYKRFVKTWICFANPWICFVSWSRILTPKGFVSYRD